MLYNNTREYTTVVMKQFNLFGRLERCNSSLNTIGRNVLSNIIGNRSYYMSVLPKLEVTTAFQKQSIDNRDLEC